MDNSSWGGAYLNIRTTLPFTFDNKVCSSINSARLICTRASAS